MKNIDLFFISSIIAFLLEIYKWLKNKRLQLADRVIFDNLIIEFLPFLFYPVAAMFFSYVLLKDIEIKGYELSQRIIATSIGLSTSYYLDKPLEWISKYAK